MTPCRLIFLLLLPLAACADPQAQSPATETHEPMPILYTVTARSLGYRLQLLEIRRDADGNLWTLAELQAPTGMAGMALESLEVRNPGFPLAAGGSLYHWIIGQSRGLYAYPDGIRFVDGRQQLPAAFQQATVIWQR